MLLSKIYSLHTFALVRWGLYFDNERFQEQWLQSLALMDYYEELEVKVNAGV